MHFKFNNSLRKSFRVCREKLIAVLLTITERQFIVTFHNPFAVFHGMFSDKSLLLVSFTFPRRREQLHRKTMWYIAIIICVQPQFAETNRSQGGWSARWDWLLERNLRKPFAVAGFSNKITREMLLKSFLRRNKTILKTIFSLIIF